MAKDHTPGCLGDRGYVARSICPADHPDLERDDGLLPGETGLAPEADPVNSPPHYKDRVPGVECIEVTEHFNFNRGNAIKYVWRAGTKGGPETEVEDLKKARWYLDREIARLEAGDGLRAD